MNHSHWADRSKHWFTIKAPLRPTAETVCKQQQLIGNNGHVLLLGGTPEYHSVFYNITAVDRESAILSNIWPGDTETKKSILADWLDVHFTSNSFHGIVGDGSLNMMQFPSDAQKLLHRCIDWLEPQGTLAVRLFSRPAAVITEADVITAATYLSWDAFRAYLNMYIACTFGTNVISSSRLEVFDNLFPDRPALVSSTGWNLNDISKTMDSYKNGRMTTSYPTQDEILSIIDTARVDVELVHVGNYELCEYFPILHLKKK
jgi:hypothetical protein